MHVPALCLAALVAASPAPSTSKGATAEELITLGEAQSARGDGRKAQASLDKALQDASLTTSQQARAHKVLGLALLQQKKPEAALPHLQQATKLAPDDEKGWLYLGLAADGLEQFDDAIAAYRSGVAHVPKSPTLAHELGMALLQTGKASEAAAVLDKACVLAETDPELHSDAAYALVVAGRFVDARAHAEQAVSLSPDNADAFYVLGMARAGSNDAKGALAAFDQALDVDETHVPALFHKGLLLQRLGRDGEAGTLFTRVLQIEPTHARARAALGTSLSRVGNDDDKAEALLREAVRVDPKFAQGFASLAAIHARRGKLDDAKKEMATALKLKPDERAWKEQLEAWKKQK